jgi:hypothetical protein
MGSEYIEVPSKCVATLSNSQFFVFYDVVAEVHNHGVKADLEPTLERGQVSLCRPNCRLSIPSIQLFFEDVPDAFPQILHRLLLAIALRYQVDRWLVVDLRFNWALVASTR